MFFLQSLALPSLVDCMHLKYPDPAARSCRSGKDTSSINNQYRNQGFVACRGAASAFNQSLGFHYYRSIVHARGRTYLRGECLCVVVCVYVCVCVPTGSAHWAKDFAPGKTGTVSLSFFKKVDARGTIESAQSVAISRTVSSSIAMGKRSTL